MNESVEKRMKLFVAGEAYPDPEKWSTLTVERRLILAESAESASAMIDGRVVIEVEINAPAILS